MRRVWSLRSTAPPVEEIFGFPDDLKVRSSMTLFARAAADPDVRADFVAVLDKFYGGAEDSATRQPLGAMISQPCGSTSASATTACGGAPDPAMTSPAPKPNSGSDSDQRHRRRC